MYNEVEQIREVDLKVIWGIWGGCRGSTAPCGRGRCGDGLWVFHVLPKQAKSEGVLVRCYRGNSL